jgi:hypothetical protein
MERAGLDPNCIYGNCDSTMVTVGCVFPPLSSMKKSTVPFVTETVLAPTFPVPSVLTTYEVFGIV